MAQVTANSISAIALVLGLSACGGGGGVNSTPLPPVAVVPTPTPTPTPPPPKPPANPGPIGLTQPGEFSTSSFAYTYVDGPDGGQAKLVAGAKVEFRYLAAEGAYEILIPGYNRGTLKPIFYNGSVCSDGTVCNPSSSGSEVTDGSSSTRQDVIVTLLDPDYRENPIYALTYTSLGNWSGKVPDPQKPGQTLSYTGTFVYGVPTAPGDVPVSGSAMYDAAVSGVALFSNGSGAPEWVSGTARLTFDFGAGTLTGFMDPEITNGWDAVPIGRYTFVDTVYSRGATTFSGRFAAPGASGPSAFDGRFNGPQAAELMGQWSAPFVDPMNRGSGTMSGILFGKKK